VQPPVAFAGRDKGITRANPHLGKGGATQYFIENMDKINLKSTNKLIKYGK